MLERAGGRWRRGGGEGEERDNGVDEEVGRRGCVGVACGCDWETAGHGGGEGAEEVGDHFRLVYVRYSGQRLKQ